MTKYITEFECQDLKNLPGFIYRDPIENESISDIGSPLNLKYKEAIQSILQISELIEVSELMENVKLSVTKIGNEPPNS